MAGTTILVDCARGDEVVVFPAVQLVVGQHQPGHLAELWDVDRDRDLEAVLANGQPLDG